LKNYEVIDVAQNEVLEVPKSIC